MSFSWCLQSYLFITFSSFNIVRTVPPDYCLSPLNRSDCNMPPKLVFSYYKPGSRCEIETWRGCPTLNKFENEYVCSLNCLFRMKYEVPLIIEEPAEPINECEVPLNTEICMNESKTVYTHVNGTCIEAEWGGCPSHNKFDDKATCDTTCFTEEPVLEKELEKLDEGPLEKINDLLKLIVEEEIITTTETKTEHQEEETTTEKETTTEEATTEEATTEEATTEEATTEEATTETETTTEAEPETTTNDDYQEVLNA